jgi:hypothetical protein
MKSVNFLYFFFFVSVMVDTERETLTRIKLAALDLLKSVSVDLVLSRNTAVLILSSHG